MSDMEQSTKLKYLYCDDGDWEVLLDEYGNILFEDHQITSNDWVYFINSGAVTKVTRKKVSNRYMEMQKYRKSYE